jgi:Uma2 family endonuclease
MEREERNVASIPAAAVEPDTVLSFEINPGTLHEFLEARAESGPRLKCFEGSVTLVSPGMTHEVEGTRLFIMILAVCQELRIPLSPLASTTWKLPPGSGDTAYEADAAYYIQSHGQAAEGQPPDLAIEIVVSNPATRAVRAGAVLGIPELWVLELPRRTLTFHHLKTRGKSRGTYGIASRSRAFPFLTSREVLERLDDTELDAIAFLENCRDWARSVLLPRHQGSGPRA